MIREQDLLDAIAECQGERNPDARTCIKLAAFYTILNNIRETPKFDQQEYSFARPTEQISYNSGSEFSEVIHGLNVETFLPIIDELMDAVHLISPKLYDATIVKLKNL